MKEESIAYILSYDKWEMLHYLASGLPVALR